MCVACVVVCWLWFVGCRLLFDGWCLVFVVCRVLFYCGLFAAHCLLRVA